MVQSLTQLWRQNLARCEQRMRDLQDRAWFDRAYARVLRFLLARYGDRPLPLPAAPRVSSPVVIGTISEPRPPKELAVIRNRLLLIHTLLEGTRPAPGRDEPDWVLAGTFASEEAAGFARQALAVNGIQPQIRKSGSAYLVEVPRCVIARALDAFELNLVESERVPTSMAGILLLEGLCLMAAVWGMFLVIHFVVR